MNLLYYRIGFASNSSSLHSTWHVKDASEVYEYIEDTDFGWNTFVCSTEMGIQKYIAAQIKMNISYEVPKEATIGFIKHIFPKIKVAEIKEMDVDHQSRWELPRDFFGKTGVFPSIKFIKALEKYLIKTNGIIIGGNDNSDQEDVCKLLNVDCAFPDRLISETIYNSKFASSNTVCIKDKGVWKLFNKSNGCKIRFSFNDDGVIYEKSSSPELIDLIISNKCSHGCPYCYRGCTPEKEEAPINRVEFFIRDLLRETPVFEIAIGGGNILEYSSFFDLCDFISDYNNESYHFNTIFNTTLSWKDFTKENTYKIYKLFESFRGIAISVSKASEIKYVLEYLKKYHVKFYRGALSFQCIPELMTGEELIKIAEQRENKFGNYHITFLGFKHTGRGNSPQYSAAEFEKNKDGFRQFLQYMKKKANDNEWFDDYLYERFGVDTELIHNFPEIKETQKSWMYSEHEGKFSCCVDLVDGYVLPSSYTPYSDEYKVPEIPTPVKRVYTTEDSIASMTEIFLRENFPKF